MNINLHFKRGPEKRRMRLRFGGWLLWMVLLAIGQQIWAQDNDLCNMNNFSATDNGNGSVALKIFFYDDNDEDEFTNDGKVTIGGKYGTVVFEYKTNKQDDDTWYWADITVRDGVCEFINDRGETISLSAGQSQRISFAREGDIHTFVKGNWFYPPAFEGQGMQFYVDAYNTHANNVDWQPFGNHITGRSFQNPTLSEPSFSNEVGKYQMTYTTTTSPKEIWNSVSNSWSNSAATSGTLYADIQDTKRDYTFKVKYQLNKHYRSNEHSVTTTLPAFHQARNFKATDFANGDTKLTWNIANNETPCQTGDAFEIQRADDAEFSSPTTIGQVSFDHTKRAYEITDRTGNLNINGPIHYRIRRTKQPAWNWGLSQTCSITKNVSHQNVASATAERYNWDNGQQAKISWTLDEKTTNKVWTDGAQVIVKRTMDYGSNNTKVEELTASDEEVEQGYLIDDLNVTCVKYTYAVYVRPGNTNYTTQKEVIATIDPEAPILPTNSGKVTELSVSKGYFSNYTSLEWKTDGKPVENFEILRRVYQQGQGENSGWTTIKTEEANTQTSYVYNDELGQPGIVYEYRVNATIKCVDDVISNPSPIVRGYRSPTGTITGQITFKYGDAVVGANVLVTSNQPELTAEQAMKFPGNEMSFMQTERQMDVPADATIQLFVKPEQAGQTATLLHWGRYQVGLQEGKPAISANGGTSWQTAEAALPTDKFSQLTAIFDTDLSLYLYIDGEKQIEVTASGKVGLSANTQESVLISAGFNGYIDEVRLWNRALDETKGDIANTYNRLLVGNENGLVAYWRLNDPVDDEAYDISYNGTDYHKNHLTIKGNVTRSEDVYPESGQLALRGMTDSAGNYQISGVPYVGNSTQYQVTPSYPGHSFEPTSTNVTIGDQQPVVSGINFKDASAIIIQGYVFYANSSIPVRDVTFSIDGSTVIGGNGRPETTNEKGQFKFSVPAGTHRVQVEKVNHTFRNDGLLLDSNDQNYNFQDASLFTDVRFWDETKVKLIGRVAGGTVEQAKPLGFSLSKNNLGDNLTLKLVLEGDASSEIFDADILGNEGKTNITEQVTHHDGKHANKVVFNQYDVTINPDSETGEYEAWLIPVKYKLDALSANGWDGLMPSSAPTIDLSNVFTEKESEYTPVDENGNTGTKQVVTYNEAFSRIHRVEPTISYKQGNKYGKTTEYFGLEYSVIPNIFGATEKPDTLLLYNRNTKEYAFKGNVNGEQQGLPIFSVGTWGFHVEATEDYAYNGITTGEEAKIDRVPTQGGRLRVTNEFNQNARPKNFELDDQGKGYIELEMDNPLFANNNISKVTFAVDINNKTYTAPQLSGVLLGADPKTDGLDFVTAGPITLLNILRDPPGSASYSWWESGHTYSFMTSTDRGMTSVGSETYTHMLGIKNVVSIGLGTARMEDAEIVNDVSATVNHEVTSNNPDSRSITITTNNRYQTSDDPLNVGSAADVFIGYSSNIYYGAINEVELLDEDTYKAKEAKEKEIYMETTINGKTYYICKGSNLNVNVSGTTLFSYPKMHIESILIPNLETLRNDLLFTLDSVSESELQAKANRDKRIYYLSTVKADDEEFGQKGKYKLIAPADYKEGEFFDPYKKGQVKNGSPDSIEVYNNAIKEWLRVLKQNEDEKLKAFAEADYVDRNRSFHASAPVEYSESYEMGREQGYVYDFTVTAGVMTEFGFAYNATGSQISISEEGGQVGTDEQNESETEIAASGFVLADEGDFDYISVDVLRVAPVDTAFKNKWTHLTDSLDNWGTHTDIDHKPEKMKQYGNFVFRTRGGATACPYEPAEYTQYQDGQQKLLNEATMQIERPSLTVEKPVVTNVPSDQAAVYNLKLMNDSQVSGVTAIFTIAIVDAQNQHGAKFSIDGVPLADGRGIEVPYGEVLNKVLEVRLGTEYDYENLALVLKSQCQSDPTDNQADIADTVYISAHFIPSSSDINIKSPTDKWTLNTNSPKDSASGKYYMPLTIDGFDVNFQGFDHIEVQYKASSEADTRWTNICSFFNDSALYAAASGEKAMIGGATINTRFFGAEDQNYDIRAVTYAKVGNDFVTKESAVISGVKDTKRPVVFGNIEPADGVLDINDEIRLTFNEPIAEGYMTEVKNFRVTGTRNGSNGDHSTALTFDGRNSYLETQVTRNLEAKDITVEMWINPSSLGQDMTLFSHGNSENTLELTLTKENTIRTRIGVSDYTSKVVNVKKDEWAHVAMTYRAANQQLAVYFNGQEVVTGVQTVPYSGSGILSFGRSLRGGNYFAGQMHEARLWTKVVDMADLIANSLRIYTGRESGLLAYYRMNEGKGDAATDKSQGATAYMHGATWNTQDGKSLTFNGKDAIAVINTSKVALSASNDYTLEFWFKAEAGSSNAALVANGKGIGEENNGNAMKVFVGFEGDELVFRNNGYEQKVSGSFRDGAWHHFVVAVNRTAGNAQIFMDGVLNSYFDSNKLGGFSGSELYAGARRWTEAESVTTHTDMFLNGAVDELRVWNMALPGSMVSNNYNVSPEGDEMGLMMYLPFSKYVTNSANIQELVYSGDDLVTDSTLVRIENAVATSEVPPVCKKAPETSIPFTFVVNKDALVINLMDTPEAIEKTTINFTVKDVSDLNGNLMESPVTWSAYIDRNQLKWSQKSITKEKKLNATMSFTVDVENLGGTAKNFKIEGLPAWLDAMPESGTIDPQGRTAITFTIDEGTNVGRYDEVIYVKGDNNVAESLPVTLKVFDEQPDWTVNPGDFKYNMNIYGRVRINNLFSADAEDMLAAFDMTGRCIGVANSQYLKAKDMWFTFLTVYSNEKHLNANQIEFRTWDASTGLVYTAYPTEEIAFDCDVVKGTVSTPVVFDAEERVVQNIQLIKGWNWISYNVASELFSTPVNILNKALFEGDEKVKDETNGVYMEYDGNRKKWVNNNPDNTLKFDNRHMFLLESPVVQKLSVAGSAIHGAENLTLNIRPNWNYIAYLPTVNLPITEALAGFEATEGDIIKSQDRFAMYNEGAGWLGSLTYMEPGKGYMLNSKKATTLTYPEVTAGTTTRSALATRAVAIQTEGISSIAGQYASNMSVVATVAGSLPLHIGDRLLAYADGELRGEAMVMERPADGEPLFFLSVGGESSEGISFALERGGEVIAETSPMLDYAPNSVRGDINQPMIIDFVNDLEISVYPNPFDQELNFMLRTNTGDRVEIILYTMAGQMLHCYQTKTTSDSYFQYRIDVNTDMPKGVYMAVVVINGEKHVYKLSKR